jgi:hypothetical protein
LLSQSLNGVIVAAVLTAFVCHGAPAQVAQSPKQDAPSKDAQLKEAQGKEALAQSLNKGLPPRATPGDYYTHGQAGPITIAAEFRGHSVPNAGAILSTEDYVVVEVGFFGQPDADFNLSSDAFALRINNKKPLPAQPYSTIFGTLKDPEWEPPVPVAPKSSTSIGGGGAGNDPGATPTPPKVPFETMRGWQQRVVKAALPEGNRTLPAAGLVFFKYHGKSDNIDSIEVIYTATSGKKTTLTLHP